MAQHLCRPCFDKPNSYREKYFFSQGFALAVRKLQKQNREKPANNTHAAETPHSSSKSSGGLYTK